MTRMSWLRVACEIIYRAWWEAFDEAILKLGERP